MQRKAEDRSIATRNPLRRQSVVFLAVIFAFGVSISSGIAKAESLQDALVAAYLANPTLKAQRAALRAEDENVARARSNFRPRVSGELEATYTDTESTVPGTDGTFDSRSYSITLNQPIFRGFQTLNQIKGAEAAVEAGRETLRNVEQTVLLDAVTAYVDVVRDLSILQLRQNNLRVLKEQQRATQDRFEVGEVTRTDVAQARARVSGATSQISRAQANLQTSRAAYARLVGHPPNSLRNPGPVRPLPNSLEEALGIGESENPSILAALFNERAQHHVVQQTKGELLPEVNLQASLTRDEGGAALGSGGRRDTATVTGVVSVPIYQAGEVSARIRQGIATKSQLRFAIDEARQSTRANVISSWGLYTAAQAQIGSDQAQVEAARIALEGVREEERVGQRTVLDVLDAEQELLDARVTLATSRRDLVVASYTLLSAIGRLSATNLGLSVLPYDPTEHYRQVKNQWIGWSTAVEESTGEPSVEVLPTKVEDAAYTSSLR